MLISDCFEMSQNPEVKLDCNTELAFTEAHLTHLNRKIVQ